MSLRLSQKSSSNKRDLPSIYPAIPCEQVWSTYLKSSGKILAREIPSVRRIFYQWYYMTLVSKCRRNHKTGELNELSKRKLSWIKNGRKENVTRR
jgi:hypothetical protein